MKIEFDEYSILPDEELLDIYKANKRARRLLCLPLLPLLYLIGTSASQVSSDFFSKANESSALGNWFILLSFAAAFVGCSFVLVEKAALHKKLTLYAMSAVFIFMCLDLIFSLILDGTVHPIKLGAEAFLIIGVAVDNYVAHSFIVQLEVLKEHPRYPFDNWRKDENYIHKASGDEVLQIIDNSINKGKVKSVGSEEFFDGEAKAYEPPKADPEKNLQQRRQVWRHHDKDDTAYTMDNLKNMYLGKTEDGELTADELEKKLWAETAPKRPREPEPEDFFQQTPVIWRTNKDGSTTLERRAPGSAPVGERESRNVLM